MHRSDEGFATAEAAVVLPSLLVVLALAVAVVTAVGAQLRCVDAARAAARVVARGDEDPLASQQARDRAPHGARIRIGHDGDQVQVTVDAELRLTHWLPALHVGARAVAEDEAAAP